MLDTRPVLVLDLDEVQVFTTDTPLADREADLRFGKMHVYKRPHLTQFLQMCSEHYQLALWSAGEADYVDYVVRRILPSEVKPLFVNTQAECKPRIDEDMTPYNIKDLNSLKNAYDLDRVLIVEDNLRNCERNLGNAVIVKAYAGAADDDELLWLGRYLVSLASAPNLRKLDKKNWRKAMAVQN